MTNPDNTYQSETGRQHSDSKMSYALGDPTAYLVFACSSGRSFPTGALDALPALKREDSSAGQRAGPTPPLATSRLPNGVLPGAGQPRGRRRDSAIATSGR